MEARRGTDLKGSICAIVTPFAEGAVDEDALRALVDWHVEQGTHGLVPVGTTGESPTLTPEEHVTVITICVEEARGRVPIIAGTGSNSTHEAVHFTREAEKAGADAALLVTPYYNKPTQEGLFQHYKAVAAATALPLVIYNIPGRSVIDMSVETMARLAQIPNIVGVKDATANLARVSEQRAACGEDFVQLSGEDGTALGFMAHGGRGCISVTANVAPALCARFQEACLKGDYGAALALQDRLYPLHKALFLETSPAPVKYALSLLGKCSEDLRLPLVPVGEKTREAVRAALAEAGLVDTAGHPLT